jgi:hypothetical protein
MAWSKSIQPRTRKNKLTNLWCCSPNPLQSRPFQTPHICSSGPSIVRSTFWNGIWGRLSSCISCLILSSPRLDTYSPSAAFAYRGIEKSHPGPMSGEWGGGGGCSTCEIWCLAKKFWTMWDSTVSSFGTDFAEMHFVPRSVRMGCTKANENLKSTESSLIVIRQFSSMQTVLYKSSVGSFSWRGFLNVHHSQLMSSYLWTA